MVRQKMVRGTLGADPISSGTKSNRITRGGTGFKKRKYRPGTVALPEIVKYQRSTDLLIPKLSFQRLVREIMNDVCDDIGIHNKRVQSNALLALQTAAEDFLQNLFSDAQIAAIHANRVTVTNVDIQLVKHFKHKNM